MKVALLIIGLFAIAGVSQPLEKSLDQEVNGDFEETKKDFLNVQDQYIESETFHLPLNAAYQYHWEVSDPEGNNFYGHDERRDGAFTSGSYFVLLPDGRRQRVDYTVNGDEGFVATVTFD